MGANRQQMAAEEVRADEGDGLSSDPRAGNLFTGVGSPAAEEEITELLRTPGLRIERIVSTGQASPPGFWYDQDRAEWVLVVSGAAGLLFEGETGPLSLGPG